MQALYKLAHLKKEPKVRFECCLLLIYAYTAHIVDDAYLLLQLLYNNTFIITCKWC